MSDADVFHDKIAKLRPTDQDTKPNTLWVGILKDNKKPSDDLVQTDCLWAKCGKNKDVSKLRKAYVSIEAPHEDIILRHAFKTVGFRPVEDHVLVNSMNTHGDDLVALEAIRKSDLPSRIGKEERVPLQNITNTAAAPQSTPAGVKLEMPEPRPFTRLVGAPTSPQTVAPTDAFRSSPSTELGWIDFNCERRELLQRVKFRVTAQEVTEMNDTIRTEWLQLTDGQIQFFQNRAIRIAARLCSPGSTDNQWLASTSRGFWHYYYIEYYREKSDGNDPHQTFESTQDFFDQSLARWLDPAWKRSSYVNVNLSYLERNPIPAMPQRIAVSADIPAAWLERECSPASDTSSDAPEHMGSPAVKKHEDDHESPPHSASQPTDVEQACYNRLNIPDLFTGCSPEQLEKGVEKGVAVLDNLRTLLVANGNTDNAEAAQWLQSIDNVQKQAVRTRTVIGVVGNTGAGKSSIINALLDEERLLPTNCMRACTAVITEISYNYDSAAYTAEIEFISENDWRVELETMFKDLLDGNGNVSKECTNEDNEAAIAYAKIKAVYPKLTKEDMSKSSVDELMQHGNVSRLLGASRSIDEADPLLFYKKLQSFVDSREKTTKPEKEKAKPREMEFWPLIKVVRLYVRTPALSTGAVIVDLPGVHDSNQARAAVAQNYMKQCSGLWICAPINRAVDDKAAKSLLGETFKRQLKMDGSYSTVTFICSKTDDISLMEAQDSLGIEEELTELWNKCDNLARKKGALKKQLDQLKETKSDYSHVIDAAEEELEVWEKLKDDLDDGKTVYPPSRETTGAPQKRKRGRPKTFSAKKARLDDSDDDFINNSSHSEGDNEGDEDSYIDSAHAELAEPLTEVKIVEKIGNLRATKKDGRQHRAQIDDEIKDLRRQMHEVEQEQDAAEAVISQKCIQGRNEYSKGAIQQDFAAGIKELDMEIQEEEDAANFNPENDIRDYDEVARSLPVFTVSSRAYQKLMGRLVKDKNVSGFTTVEETQIPQLQEHAKKTTEAGRQANCKRFLNSLSQLLNSLRLWVSSDGSSNHLTERQKWQEARSLSDKLEKLDKDLESEIHALCGSLVEEMQENIFDHFSTAIQQAISEAPNTACRWGTKVNRDDRSAGGLYWATYKAICRRDGVFTNAHGLHDWNTQLTEPIIKNIANGWERTFSRRMPSVLGGLANKNGALLMSFHKTIETRTMKNGTSLASLEMLKHQLPTYKDSFRDLSVLAQAQISTRQKDINREFVPVVAEAMKRAYDDCENERGPGQYARMKAMMSQHVEGVRHQMFNDSTNAVKKSLKKLIKEIEDFLLGKADEVFMSVKRDYESVVLGRQTSSRQLPREHRQIRTEVNNLIEGTEMIFKKVVGIEPETPKPSVAELGGKETPPKPDLVRQDAATDNGEQDDANFKTDDEDDVFKSVIHPDGTATRPSLTPEAEPEKTKNDSTLAGAEVSEDPASSAFERAKPPTEASHVLDIPAAPAKRTAPPDGSGPKHELAKSHSMSANDLDQAIDGDAPESSRRGGGERAASAASWVQSWFLPRE